jgi:predicted metal-binding protein
MTMTETPEIEAPKPKRKWRRKYKRRAVAKIMTGTGLTERQAKKSGNEFAGMTAADCCDACKETNCIITGIAICGHPMKGALQARLMMNREVVARYKRAKQVLAHAKLDLRTSE